MERDRIRFHTSSRSDAGSDALDAVADEALADAVDRHRPQPKEPTPTSSPAGPLRSEPTCGPRAYSWLTPLSDPVRPRLTRAEADPVPTQALFPSPRRVSDLLRLAVDHTGHTGTAVVITGDPRNRRTHWPRHRAPHDQHRSRPARRGRPRPRRSGPDQRRGPRLRSTCSPRARTPATPRCPIDESAEHEGWEAYATQSGSLRTRVHPAREDQRQEQQPPSAHLDVRRARTSDTGPPRVRPSRRSRQGQRD